MRVWHVDPIQPSQHDIDEAARLLKKGGIVAFPTETVYGLGANALMESAVQDVFRLKGRPADNPLIVHIAHPDMLGLAASGKDWLCHPVKRAIDAFWPGPLTIIVPANEAIAPSVRPGLLTVGVRCPDHPVARALIQSAGCPVAAPSANVSGRPSPTRAADVLDDFGNRLAGLVDGGPCMYGIESTVAAISVEQAVIYRPGHITREQLEAVTGVPAIQYEAEQGQPVASPGLKYRHYAPEAAVEVWWGDKDAVDRQMASAARDACARPGAKVGVVLEEPRPWAKEFGLDVWVPEGDGVYAERLARELYHLLRSMDKANITHIIVEGIAPHGIGAGVMNRLARSAEGRVFHAQ